MDDWSDVRLADAASRAFTLGLQDGRAKPRPRTAYEVALEINLPSDRRNLHRQKIRQVYGAGFDIGAMQRRLPK